MPEAPPLKTNHWDRRVDWQAAGDEAARQLSGYLRVDTRNPPGNETEGARYLAALLEKEGISSEIIEFAPGRGSLVARLRGNGTEGALCLLSHIDVATAEAREWPEGRGPLSGTIDEQGMIWGRGALDMKGMGALELQTLIWLKRLSVPLRRDVILLAVADEEVHNLGMKQLAEERWTSLGCTHVLNEGGLGIRNVLFPGHTVFAISVAEKGVLWVRATLHGKGGHGSTPMPEHPPARLALALEGLKRRRLKPRMHASLVEFFARVGMQRGGGTGFVLQRPFLVQQFLTRVLMEKPGTRAALIDTINLTGLSTGTHEPNVVPSQASAIFDIRLLPGSDPKTLLEELRELLGNTPSITFEILHQAPPFESPWQGDPLFEALVRRLEAGRPDVTAGPVLSVGYTDSIVARMKGARAYGLIPFEVTQGELETMHGVGERVSVENVRNGLRLLFSVVTDVAAAGPPPTPTVPAK